MPITTKKDIAKSVKTLLVLLQSMRGRTVRITLRNDTLVTGTIIAVDSDMKIELKNATVEVDKFYHIDRSTLNLLNLRRELSESTVPEPGQNSKALRHYSDLGTEQSADNNVNNDSCMRGTVQATDSGDHFTDGEHNDPAVQAADQDHDSSATLHEYLVVMGSRVRHIDLPTDCDPLSSTRLEIQRIKTRARQWTKKDIVTDTLRSTTTHS